MARYPINYNDVTKQSEYKNASNQWVAVPQPYKSFVCIIAQSGTNAPTEILRVDSIGMDAAWSRQGDGNYQLLFSQTPNNDKVFLPYGRDSGGHAQLQPFQLNNGDIFGYWGISANFGGFIQVLTFDANFIPKDLSAMGIDKLTLPEIRLYG